ncbi:hypothetical protein [Legionella tunisiensis]|uniref:hypothetical protein n=1 Tax=Legionella tunisiensis TaxID=1034944 RepID=UPI001E45F689|nr:hypothetical protein [Legionella tunisiensis]
MKASGLGLAYPTQQFDVPITPSSDELISDTLHEIEWQMVSFMPHLACSAAICYNPQINKIHYQIIKDPTIFNANCSILKPSIFSCHFSKCKFSK